MLVISYADGRNAKLTDVENAMSDAWSVEDSAALYHIGAWGKGYFATNAAGHVVIRPDGTPASEIDLLEVVEGLKQRDLGSPLLIRFSNILSHRLLQLQRTFAIACRENGYRGQYAAVYPIKVNQQRPVIEEVCRYGRDLGFGIEVGSKPELLAVMAIPGASPERLIVCNGFKDDSYLEAVTLAKKLGRSIIPIVESIEEFRLLIKHSEHYQVRPQIGVRLKLSSETVGRWRNSGGFGSKFGLFVSEIMELLEALKERGMEDCLQFLHCHPGSQLQDIRSVKDAVGELAHVYAELVRMGAGLRYIDVGGGLGVDYDGSQSTSPSSMNYTLEEYASEVVYRIASVCNESEIEHPTIISESGRAIAAYQSVLVFNVLSSSGVSRFQRDTIPAHIIEEDTPQPLRDLADAFEAVSERTVLECYHDAVQAHEQVQHLFNLGYLPLKLRAVAEEVFWATCLRVRDICAQMDVVPEELAELDSMLNDTYYCNFSLFQSLPDTWAIDQLFPIMPIHRLHERPTRKGILADLTCDSDGRIDRFIGERGVNHALDLHALRAGEEYYLAAFLVGAYQETLGDLHNLFGDTHVVHIRLRDQNGWWIDEIVRGDTAGKVLSYAQYDAKRLYKELSHDCEEAVHTGRLALSESQTLLRFYQSAMNAYTYLESD